jgi:hypothetical protein
LSELGLSVKFTVVCHDTEEQLRTIRREQVRQQKEREADAAKNEEIARRMKPYMYVALFLGFQLYLDLKRSASTIRDVSSRVDHLEYTVSSSSNDILKELKKSKAQNARLW